MVEELLSKELRNLWKAVTLGPLLKSLLEEVRNFPSGWADLVLEGSLPME